MLDLLYTSSKTLAPAFSSLYMEYIKSWDAFMVYGTTPADTGGRTLYKLFRDGTLLNLGYGPSKGQPGSMPYGTHFWKSRSTAWPGRFRRGDDVTGFFLYQDTFVTGLTDVSANDQSGAAHFLDAPKDRYVLLDNYHHLRVHELASGVLLYDLPVQTLLGTAYQVVSITWVGENKVAVIAGASGKFIIFDYINLIYDPINTVGTCIAASYDNTNGIITIVGTDRKIRLYPLVAIPTGLSSPAFDPFVSEVTTRRGYKVKTRLLDASGNPCVGKVIRWDSPNIGYFEKQTTKTGADGYAWNYYFAPFETLGTEILTVRTIV